MGEVNVPFYRHSLTPDNSKYVEEVLKTPFLTSGPIGKEVESQLCTYFNVIVDNFNQYFIIFAYPFMS
jgi:dTDP-4-amino-4,6-dideoxygalactose transaminase